MKPAAVMVMASVASCVAAIGVTGPALAGELVGGMVAPLGVAVISWVAVERAFRRAPGQVTNVMVVAFGVKMVFFGAYLALMLRGLSMRPVPFVVSFTVYFIGLYAAEAWCLRRLFAEGPSGAR